LFVLYIYIYFIFKKIRHYKGRGAFESIGAGIDMIPGDIAFKVINFIFYMKFFILNQKYLLKYSYLILQYKVKFCYIG